MFGVKMTWTVDPAQAMPRLAAGIRNRCLRIALNAGASPVKQAVIASAPKDLGNLSKATAIRTRHYKNRDSWVAVVGASSRYKKAKRTANNKIKKKIDKSTGKKTTQYIRPAYYQHLVDRGTRHSRPRRYLPAAFRRSVRQFEQVCRARLKQEIEALMRQN